MKKIHPLIYKSRSLILGSFCLGLPSLAFSQTVIPANWSYPSADKDTTAPGFFGFMHQARQSSGLSATVARGNAQLRDELIDPATLAPYMNVAVDSDNPDIGAGWTGTAPINPDGSFVEAGMMNYSANELGQPLDNGSFNSLLDPAYEDQFFPGLPGRVEAGSTIYENGSNFAAEFVTWLDLPAGEILLGVYHDDAFELAFHPNDSRDIFRTQVLGFDSNSVFADRTVTLNIEAAGLYPVRVLLAQWVGSTSLEFYTAPTDDPGNLTLVNDPNIAESIKAYRGLTTATRPYVTAVSPAINATGIAPATTITASIENLGSETPVMTLNDSPVTFTSETNGSTTTLTHTPATPFATGESITIGLTYGNTTSTWSFVTQTGRKALLITGGGGLNVADGWISSRLANQFGFDVTVASDGLVNLDSAAGADLIFNSATVNSGLVANDDFETLPIPLINVESFNADDFRLVDAPYGGNFSNNPVSDTIVIGDATHPLAGGLPAGETVFLNSTVQFHKAIVPANGIPIATPVTDTGFGVIYGIEAGSTVIDGDLSDFTHPARRVFFGLSGNDGAANYNDTGATLFDAAVDWALSTPPTDAPPKITQLTKNADDTVTVTWESSDDLSVNYTLYINDSLNTPINTWPDENDFIPSSGVSTTYTTTLRFSEKKFFFAIGVSP